MRAVYPNVHTLIKSKLTTSCTTASVERVVYQDGGVVKYLQNHCGEERLNCNWFCIAMITLHRNVKVNYRRNRLIAYWLEA